MNGNPRLTVSLVECGGVRRECPVRADEESGGRYRRSVWPGSRRWRRPGAETSETTTAKAIAESAERGVARQLLAAELKNAERIEDANAKSWSCRRIAEAQSQLGDVASAKVTAGQITHPRHKASAWRRIAAAEINARDLVEARKSLAVAAAAAANISQCISRLGSTREIVETQVKASDLAGAAAAAAQISEKDDQAFQPIATLPRPTRGPATWQAHARVLALANTAAAEIKTDYDRAALLCDIAEIQSQAADIAEAVATAKQIGDEGIKASAYSSIGAARRKAGDVPARKGASIWQKWPLRGSVRRTPWHRPITKSPRHRPRRATSPGPRRRQRSFAISRRRQRPISKRRTAKSLKPN